MYPFIETYERVPAPVTAASAVADAVGIFPTETSEHGAGSMAAASSLTVGA